MKAELVKQIHDILGTLDPPELQEIKTKRIILLIARTLNQMIYVNHKCSPMCDGFHKYENTLTELIEDMDNINDQFYCRSCMAMFKEECCCDDEVEY